MRRMWRGVSDFPFTIENAYLTAIADEEGCFSFAEIPYGEHVIREITAPEGYILSEEIYPVVISKNAQVVEITAENKPITVEISKHDVYGDELKGATMQLVDENGNVVDEWVSDGTNHVISKLLAGKYTLKEVASPDGYIIATDIVFEVFTDGSVTVENIEVTAVSEKGHPLVVMVDDTTKVKISKQDITTGEELEGATL